MLGVPTFDKMTTNLIKSRPVGESLENRVHMQSWSREDISNQYLDKTMSKETSGNQIESNQNPLAIHIRSTNTYQNII
jgi:hypothetical protein